MKIPIIPYPTNTYFRVFLLASLMAAFSSVIAVKINDLIREEKKKCLNNKRDNLYCKVIYNIYISNLGLFLATFLSTFILYFIFYLFLGYGTSSLVG